MKTIRKTNSDKWNLKKIYKTDALWEKDLKSLKSIVAKLNTYKGFISTSNDLLNVFKLNKRIEYKDMKIFTYAYLKLELDKRDTKLKSMLARSVSNSSIVSAEISWVHSQISSIPTWRLKKFSNLKKLSAYRESILSTIKSKNQVTLSRKEERVLTLAKGVFDSFNEIRNDIELNNIRFPKIVSSGGRAVSLNHKNIAIYDRHEQRSIRKQVHFNKNRAYSKNANSFSGLLKGHIQSKIIEAKTYGNTCTVEFQLSDENIDRNYLESFIAENTKNNKKFKKYFDLKKKDLNLKELKQYDIFASSTTSKKISYSEARELFKSSVNVFGKEYNKIVDKAFAENWIDSADTIEKKDPSNLGFSFNPYIAHPHVFLTYQGDMESVMTLSHEVGHAVHGHFLNKNNSFHEASSSFILSEAIAFTNEMLTLYKIIQDSKSQSLKEQALSSLRDMFFININQKALETEFELRAYDLVEQNKKWSGSLLNKEYLSLEKKYNGKFVDLKDSTGVYWAIGDSPFSNFYSAKYLIAFCVAVNIVERLVSGDKDFTNRFNSILKIGNSVALPEILKIIDIDLMDVKSLVRNSYTKFESLL